MRIVAPAILAYICSPYLSHAFSTQQQQQSQKHLAFVIHKNAVVRSSNTAVRMSAMEDDDFDDEDVELLKESQLQGNRREPTVQEISIMDDMITKLAAAKPYELPNAVSKAIRVVSSPRFFLRIAERADMATDEVEKERLSAFASNLVSTLEAVVSTTEDRMDERAAEVESVVKAAAEPDSGEFLVPLTVERIEAMRAVLNKLDEASLDEGFLSTVDAWMNKSQLDGMDGMVSILQKVLQIYAGTAIVRAREQLQANVGAAVSGKNQAQAAEALAGEDEKEEKPAKLLLEKLFAMDCDYWDMALEDALSSENDEISPDDVMAEVQKTIEGVVLGLENGSMAQRVQAEYLRELVSRIEKFETK